MQEEIRNTTEAAKNGSELANNFYSDAAIHANTLMVPDFPDLKYARTMMPVVMSLFE